MRAGAATIWLWLAAAAAIVAPAAAFAQMAAGAITGAIVDQAGTPVPGASVTITNVATNQTRLAVTTVDGIYSVPNLAPGEYRVEVALAGFKTARHSGIQVSTGDKARLDVELSVGDIREEITVAGDA